MFIIRFAYYTKRQELLHNNLKFRLIFDLLGMQRARFLNSN